MLPASVEERTDGNEDFNQEGSPRQDVVNDLVAVGDPFDGDVCPRAELVGGRREAHGGAEIPVPAAREQERGEVGAGLVEFYLEVPVDEIQLGKVASVGRNAPDDVPRRGEGMNRATYPLVEARVVRDKTYAFVVRLGHEERWRRPFCWLRDADDDALVQEVLNDFVGLRLKAEGDGTSRGDAKRAGVILEMDVHWWPSHWLVLEFAAEDIAVVSFDLLQGVIFDFSRGW